MEAQRPHLTVERVTSGTVAGTLAVGAAILCAAPLNAQQPHARAALFDSHEILAITVFADLGALGGDRGEERPARPARLRLHDAEPGGRDLSIELRTRGNTRRQRGVCRFPPLRVEFDSASSAGTVFEGQRRLKLVTHCRDSDAYERNVVEEYLVYRMYNTVTEASFRVRPARVTYVDTPEQADSTTRFGFFIESDDHMAARVGGVAVEQGDEPRPRTVAAEALAVMAVFQFLIGNTDWSVTALHNVVAVVPPSGSPVPVPYDFDYSGFVDAPYALPAENLGTPSVRIRVFRGFCQPPVDYERLYQRMLQSRSAVTDLIRQTVWLEQRDIRELLDYLDEGWSVLENPERARREIEQQCRATRGG